MAIVAIVGCEGALDRQATASPPSSAAPSISPNTPTGSDAKLDTVELEVDVVGSGARITIANRTDGPVAGLDQRSQCSVLIVEVEAVGTWAPTADCPSGPPPTDIPIAAGASLTVDLVLEPGTYRVTFPYSPGERFDPATATEAVSDPFTAG